jgi:aminopeptidase N
MRAFVIAASFLGAVVALAADTYPRQAGVDAQHYAFKLTLLTTDSNEITGEATVRLRIVSPETREALLDFATPLPEGMGMTVTAVTRNGTSVPFTHTNNHLRLPVDGVRAGEDATFTIAYHGIPANGLRLLNNIHGDRCAFSENWYNQARQWLPVIDHIADKATGEFIITTRSDYQVVGNGALVEEADLPGGLRRTHWKQEEPIAPWLYALGVARFVVHHGPVVRGVPLSFWTFPQDAERGLPKLEKDARGAFEFFSDRVGPYAYDKLAHVQAAGMGGGMESTTNIFYGEKNVNAGSVPVVHETAHQWFGNSVTESDWNDVWLSEGFATYFTLLYTEYASGREAFVDGLRRSRDNVLRAEKAQPNTPVVHADFDESGRAGPNTQLAYQKGGWTLHMLRDRIGTDAFWRGIRAYYREHMNGLATTDDLRRAMEAESGQDLTSFFKQWLTRSGVPAIEGTWRYDAAAKRVVITVRQTQTGDPYEFPLDVGVTPASGTTRVVRVQVKGRELTASIPADAEPASVTLDPNVWLLADFGSFSRQVNGGDGENGTKSHGATE